MKTKILLLVFICFSGVTYAQHFDSPPTEEQLAAINKAEFAGVKVKFNTPKRFHKVRLTDASMVYCTGIHGEAVGTFRELVANNDTSIAIGVYATGHYSQPGRGMDMKANAKRRLYYVDTLATDFVHYSKKQLAAWHTDFGIKYATKVQLFLNRFTNAWVISIANIDREVVIVYLYTESQKNNMESIIKKTKNIVTPMDN